MILGLSFEGITPMVLGDLKPDYRDLIAALGGQVIRVGRGTGHINVLDPGSLAAAARRIGGAAGMQLQREARERSLQMVSALVSLIRRRPVGDDEESVLAAALNVLARRYTGGEVPTLPDLVQAIDDAPPEVMAVALARGDNDRYRAVVDPLHRSLLGLLDGPLGDIFAGSTTTPIPVDSAGVCVDISGINERDERLTAAVMIASWSDGFGAIQAASALADHGLAPRRQFLVVLDELWRPLRIGAGLPDRMDALTRLDRSLGVGQVMITHQLKDMESLPDEADRMKARGFASRAGMIACAGLPADDLADLSKIVPLSKGERAIVESWNTPPSWTPQNVAQAADGSTRPATSPGVGKFLIKVGGRSGIPLHVRLTDIERELHDTNARWVTAATTPAATSPATTANNGSADIRKPA
jgi:hypothetical protein